MKTAFFPHARARRDYGAHLAAARAEAAGAGRLVPARLLREWLVLRPIAGKQRRHHEDERRHVSVGMDYVGLVLLAKWTRATLAFALASFSQSRVHRRAARAAAASLNLGAPEPGDGQDGAWPREQPDDVDAKATAATDRIEKYVVTMIDGI